MSLGVAIALLVCLAAGVLIGRRLGAPPAPVPHSRPEPEPDGVAGVLLQAANQLEIGLIVAAPGGRVVYRNDAATALRGTHVGVLVDEHVDRALAAARTGERLATTVELHGPPKLALALVAEPMPGGAAVVTIQDVSERKRIDAVRTDFVANISHELKTPIGALAVLAEALADERDAAVIRRVADRIVTEAHRAVRTIDDLLELSRIEQARSDGEIVELNAIVRAAIARGRVVDSGRGVQVEAFDAPESVCVRADGRQLVSAIGNLVENAVKYSDDGGSVQVGTKVDERFVEVVVTDHGVGIPERDLDRIFERFYRVDRARSRETGGTGLGLAIVRHVATNHGGEVLVSSTEGEGSTFTFRLPASLVVPAPHGAAALQAGGGGTEREEPAR